MLKFLLFSCIVLSPLSAWAQPALVTPGNNAAAVGQRYRLNPYGPYPYGYGAYPVTPPGDANTAVVGQPYNNYGYPGYPGYDPYYQGGIQNTGDSVYVPGR